MTVFLKGTEEEKTRRGRTGPVKMEAGIGGTRPQAKELLKPPKPGRGEERSFPKSIRGHGPTDTLISYFWPLELGENKFVLF